MPSYNEGESNWVEGFVTDVKHYMHTLYPDSHGTLASVSTWKGIVMKISAAKNCVGKSKAEVKPSNF